MLSLRPKHQQNRFYVLFATLIVFAFISLTRAPLGKSNIGGGGEETTPSSISTNKEPKEYPIHIHLPDTFVPAISYSGPLKKPLEVISSSYISCPERGGKNTQCGKVFAEYQFKIKEPNDYYLYIQVIAPGLNDNSLWIGLDDTGVDSQVFEDCTTSNAASSSEISLIPHKHLTSSKKFLCCPAYLGKNKKKGLVPFYSDCCYEGLGKDGKEKGCVLDLEVDDTPKWNELPRIIRTNVEDTIVKIRIYAREDGTSWTGLVLSNQVAYDERGLAKLKKSSA